MVLLCADEAEGEKLQADLRSLTGEEIKILHIDGLVRRLRRDLRLVQPLLGQLVHHVALV